jgi:hypothetical protein
VGLWDGEGDMVFMGKGTQQHNTCLKGDSELVGTYLGLQTIPEGFLRAATDGYPLQHLMTHTKSGYTVSYAKGR